MLFAFILKPYVLGLSSTVHAAGLMFGLDEIFRTGGSSPTPIRLEQSISTLL